MQIALLTDFGTCDPYVAAMKGVIVARTDAGIHDLTHDIEPFDVLGAAWFLRNVERYWPAGTIFVAVVDPGVGTTRQIVALEKEGRIFLAPDNGLLTFVLAGATGVAMRAVTDESLFLPDGSNTFHGRDRFAPVAAALANGLSLRDAGPPIASIILLSWEPPDYASDVVRGTIVDIDRFGNALTDIEVSRLSFPRFSLSIGELTIDRVESNYGDAAPGPFAIVGSSGCLEISLVRASAAAHLGLQRMDRLEVRPLPV